MRRSEPSPEVWLLVEWPEVDSEPSKYRLSNLPAVTSLERLVYLAKLRWLIERDDQELKQELGLGHYEGRGWPGFHHDDAPWAALAIAAYGFLLTERLAIPPQDPVSARNAKRLPDPEDPPIRPQRHQPGSIATRHIQIALALTRKLMRCPCCQRKLSHEPHNDQTLKQPSS